MTTARYQYTQLVQADDKIKRVRHDYVGAVPMDNANRLVAYLTQSNTITPRQSRRLRHHANRSK